MVKKPRFALRLKYLIEDEDRHGNIRIYVRLPGRSKIRIRGFPGSADFMAAYQDAVSGLNSSGAPAAPKRSPARYGTLTWLCSDYYQSGEFKILDSRTQRIRRNTLEKICDVHGDKLVSAVEVRHIQRIQDERAPKIEAANSVVKILRQVFARAVAIGLIKHNPAREVKYLHNGSTGFHTWTMEEIAQFQAHHPIGSKARLAMTLLLYTGQRRSDVVTFGRQHVREGRLHFTQVKNRSRYPVELKIPVAPELRKVLDATKNNHLQFLVTEWGKPFSSNGFGNKFRRWCDEAGLHHCSAHGLRKACATILAEMGCSDKEIMAVTGHRSTKQVGCYTRGADQGIMATKAMKRLTSALSEDNIVPLDTEVASGGTLSASNPLKIL